MKSRTLKKTFALLACASAAAALLSPLTAQAGNEVVIGDIDDMSGLYADVIGQGGIEAVGHSDHRYPHLLDGR